MLRPVYLTSLRSAGTMKVLFRTDCDNRQGLGHVMRCIALAHSFVAEGAQVAFACSKQDGVIHVKSVGFDAINLCSLSERDQIAAIANQYRSDTLSLIIADSYEFSGSYLEALNDIAPTAYIDDLHTPELNISAIVNGNITADSFIYSKLYEQTSTRLLIGPKYNILRSEFYGQNSIQIKDKVKRVLVTSGGSDPHGASIRITETLLECEPLYNAEIVVMAGPLSNSVNQLQSISAKHPNVAVIQNASNVAEVMRSCDMAIAAAGGTMNELCACGVPSVVYALANNQVRAAFCFSNKRCALDGGAVWDAAFSSRVKNCTEKLAQSRDLRFNISKNAHALFDGMGANRVATELLALVTSTNRSHVQLDH